MLAKLVSAVIHWNVTFLYVAASRLQRFNSKCYVLPCCVYDLVKIKKRSCFGLQYLLWSPRTQLERTLFWRYKPTWRCSNFLLKISCFTQTREFSLPLFLFVFFVLCLCGFESSYTLYKNSIPPPLFYLGHSLAFLLTYWTRLWLFSVLLQGCRTFFIYSILACQWGSGRMGVIGIRSHVTSSIMDAFCVTTNTT